MAERISWSPEAADTFENICQRIEQDSSYYASIFAKLLPEKKTMININTKKFHNVKNIHFEKDDLCLNIDGKEYIFPLENHSQLLLKASETERNHFEISHSGYGIHWSMIDEDLSLDGLLGIVHKPRECLW